MDGNHAMIAQAFRALGCSVESLAQVGKGVPDLLVARRGITWLIEVKQPKGKETPDQTEWAARWTGCRAIARSVDDVANIVGRINRQATLVEGLAA